MKATWLCLIVVLAMLAAACGESEERKAQRAADMVAAAEKHFGFGEYDKVLELCEQAIELDGKNAKAYAIRGRLHAKQGKFSEAESDMRKWMELAPTDAQGPIALARLQGSLGDYKTALETAKAAYQLAPDDVNAKGWVLWFRTLNNDYKGVAAEAVDALRIDRHCVPAHLAASASLVLTGELNDARKEAGFATSGDPSGEEAFLMLGRALLEAGDCLSARKEINTAISNNEHGFHGKLLLAVCEARAGKLEAAQAALDAAAGAPDGFKTALEEAKAEIAFAAGKHDDALKHLEAILSATPGHERMIELRATIRMCTGKVSAGLTELDATIKASPVPEAYVQRSYLRMFKGDNKGAYEDARKAMGVYPHRQSVKLVQGHAARAYGRGPEAMNAYTVAYSKLPRSWLARAGILATRPMLKDPVDAEAERRLVEEDIEGAISEALEAIEQTQNPARDHYGIACLFALAIDMQIWNPKPKWDRAARIEQALAHLQKAREAGYSNRAWWDYDPNLKNLRDEPKFKQLWP